MRAVLAGFALLFMIGAVLAVSQSDISEFQGYADAINASRNYMTQYGPAEQTCWTSGTLLASHPCNDMASCAQTASMVCVITGAMGCQIEVLAQHILTYSQAIDSLNQGYSQVYAATTLDQMQTAFNTLKSGMDSVKNSKLRFPRTTTCNDCLGICPEANLDYTSLNAAFAKISSMGGTDSPASTGGITSIGNCADGTQYGKCSTVTHGMYCGGSVSAPILGLDSRCASTTTSPNSGIPSNCADGTPYGKCSTANPGYYCSGDSGARALVQDTTHITCKCSDVPGYIEQGENCVAAKCGSINNGECDPSNKPKICVNGVLVDNAQKCGCPRGYVFSGNSCSHNEFSCLKKVSNICNYSNETMTYEVTYIFDRGYKTVVTENLTYPRQSCQNYEIMMAGDNCDIEKERQPVGGASVSPAPVPEGQKTVDCDRCPAVCERKPPNGIICGACICPTNVGYCNQAGIRNMMDGQAIYCLDELWRAQKENQESCQNSFECKSNFCSDGVCYNIAQDVHQNTNLLQQIIDFLKKIFGG